MSKDPVPKESTQTKIWIHNDLLEFVDAIAERDERSRAFVVNQALSAWRNKLKTQRRLRKTKRDQDRGSSTSEA